MQKREKCESLSCLRQKPPPARLSGGPRPRLPGRKHFPRSHLASPDIIPWLCGEVAVLQKRARDVTKSPDTKGLAAALAPLGVGWLG